MPETFGRQLLVNSRHLSYIVNETFSQNIKISKVWVERSPSSAQQHLTLAESCWAMPSWLFSTNEMSPPINDRSGKRIGAETAASLGALRKSKPTPIQDSSFPRQEFHTEPRRLPSAFSNQAPVLAEAGSVLSSTSVEAAAFSSFNDTPEPNSVQAVSHDESATYPGVQGLLTTPFPW